MQKSPAFKIGHVLFKVKDLQAAVADYQALGFTVTMGGLPGKAVNALIYLQDGSFLELYTASLGKMTGFAPVLLKVIKCFMPKQVGRAENYVLSPEGMNDFALDSVPAGAFEHNLELLRGCGLQPIKPMKMKRVDYKGRQLRWRVSMANEWRLPFFMEDYVPHIEHTEEETTHSNGVTGIREIVISVDNYTYFTQAYKKLCGQYTEQTGQTEFQFHNCCVTLKQADTFKMESITLYGRAPGEFPVKKTHGVPIQTVQK